MRNFPRTGDWVRWITDHHGREGQVVDASWPSFTVRWLGVDEPQVFPWGMIYFTSEQSSTRMEIIARPKKAASGSAKRSTPASGAVTVAQAAKTLKTTPRAIRSKLRSGKLTGLQRDGRWVEVYL